MYTADTTINKDEYSYVWNKCKNNSNNRIREFIKYFEEYENKEA